MISPLALRTNHHGNQHEGDLCILLHISKMHWKLIRGFDRRGPYKKELLRVGYTDFEFSVDLLKEITNQELSVQFVDIEIMNSESVHRTYDQTILYSLKSVLASNEALMRLSIHQLAYVQAAPAQSTCATKHKPNGLRCELPNSRKTSRQKQNLHQRSNYILIRRKGS